MLLSSKFSLPVPTPVSSAVTSMITFSIDLYIVSFDNLPRGNFKLFRCDEELAPSHRRR
jgi:hypothetical protein